MCKKMYKLAHMWATPHPLPTKKRHQERFALDREAQRKAARWLQKKFLAEVERIVAEIAGIVDQEASRVGRCWDCIRKWHNRVSKILSP